MWEVITFEESFKLMGCFFSFSFFFLFFFFFFKGCFDTYLGDCTKNLNQE